MNSGIEHLQTRFEIALEMHAQCASAAFGQHVEIAAGLRRLDHPKAGLLTGYREILVVIGGDLQEYAAVRTAFISLSGGMQEARAEFSTGRDMAAVADCKPHVLQAVDMRIITLDIGEQRHVIPPARAGEMGFQPGTEIAIG